ncbi:MAG TPA: 1-deoxy-D-xylulose-5-phosphate synthase [Streptosporangiaceae bacterium]|jgi:1-deoxy-D-xylulose-5-phosphate synthase|nr:1-deoxy-D-xylulose-5-phosphate synthase [Streptosporangiaceae bacterium]
MTLLDSVSNPRDVKALSPEELPELAAEIRSFLIEVVSRNGGHLGPNLGVVELTIALHRVFDSPADQIVWDTGHQSYVHKLLTGRAAGFERLRQRGGVSGYPNRAESEHDFVENSHASTSLSYADGLAKAMSLRGDRQHRVIAIIGDGALTGGMAWEALNNIAAAKDRPVVIVVNDNGRSYQRTIGGLAEHLAAVRVSQRYEQVLDLVKTTLSNTPLVGPPLFETLHGIKKGLKDFLQPQVLFEDLGLKYLGPIDGHDEQVVEHALARAKEFGGPVLVHVITQKGRGYALAEENDEDCLHQVKPGAAVHLNGSAPLPVAPAGTAAKPAKRDWTAVFTDEIVAIGARRPDVVAITAAMLHPTGLAAFAQAYPDRVFDVGIAEQHAVTSAAGLAMGGLHPVVAIYATFLNRAFDQVLMDVAMHKLPVTFVLDRAGVTGPDGASHHGMWDGSLLQLVPGIKVAVPRDGTRLTELLREAVAVSDGPTAIRFPRGSVADDLQAVGNLGGMDLLVLPDGGAEVAADVLLVAVGPMAAVAVEAAGRLAGQGISVTVVDPRWVKPLDPALAEAAAQHRLVATVEDNGIVGGFGDAVARLLREHDVDVPVRTFGLPQRFLEHGERAEVLADAGLTPQHLALAITEAVARLTPDLVPDRQV